MHTKKLVIGVAALAVIALSALTYVLVRSPHTDIQSISSQESMSERPYLNTPFMVAGREVTLKDGVDEVEAAPGSASKVVTRYFGNEVRNDMNGDGRDDVTFLVTQESGGSGTFFYAVTALSTEDGFVATDAFFLGDRIAPQTTEGGPNNTVIVNFADRAQGESFDTEPSHGKSVTILLDPVSKQLSQLVVDTASETGWDTPQNSGKIKADVFTGTLEEVNTGCFADAECYVVVDGKHVTAIRGWSRDTVGSVQGVDGFGDLASHIGKTVEVYAHDLQDGTYTLYGSEGFYIKLITDSTSGVGGGTQGIAVGEQNPSAPGDGSKPQIVKDGCMVGGCSGQLCGEGEAVRDTVTTCEYRAAYACYQVARCERQQDGQCGWTMTPTLNQCLQDKANEPVETVY